LLHGFSNIHIAIRGSGGIYLFLCVIVVLVGVTFTCVYSINYITELERNFRTQITALKDEVKDSLAEVDTLHDKLSEAESTSSSKMRFLTYCRPTCNFEDTRRQSIRCRSSMGTMFEANPFIKKSV
jgi:hypothetical protein